MEPYYSDDLVTLYHGDCREISVWLDADVLVTDPPYGRGWQQGGLGSRQRESGGGGTASQSHGGILGDEGAAVRDEVLTMWGSRRAIAFGDLLLPPPVGTKQVLCYRKPSSAGIRGATANRRRDLEAIYLIGPHRSGIGGRTSVVETRLANVADPKFRTGHPHSKPIDVMCELIEMTDGGSIADPFAGSGSTLFAAKYLGRRATGVELEERYCEIAAKRLAQDTLFGGAA